MRMSVIAKGARYPGDITRDSIREGWTKYRVILPDGRKMGAFVPGRTRDEDYHDALALARMLGVPLQYQTQAEHPSAWATVR